MGLHKARVHQHSNGRIHMHQCDVCNAPRPRMDRVCLASLPTRSCNLVTAPHNLTLFAFARNIPTRRGRGGGIGASLLAGTATSVSERASTDSDDGAAAVGPLDEPMLDEDRARAGTMTSTASPDDCDAISTFDLTRNYGSGRDAIKVIARPSRPQIEPTLQSNTHT